MKNNFLIKLQEEAQAQKKLNEGGVFPEFFDGITSFVGNNSWQTLLFLAVISAVLVELVS